MAASRHTGRRTKLIAVCEALPEATLSGETHIKFAVRAKTFAYYLHNHHGDGRVAICCKVSPGEQDMLIRHDPERFFMPAYLGAKGWIGLRIDLPRIDWDEVQQLVTDSYRMVAPKLLAGSMPSAAR